jgi:hypothetical protein
MNCYFCLDTGMVCENHPKKVWSGILDVGKACGCGAGMPCPACCSKIPEDGTQPIRLAFVPDWMRD